MSTTAQILVEDIVDLTSDPTAETHTLVCMVENVECIEVSFNAPVAPHIWQMLSCPSIASVESNHRLVIDKSYEYNDSPEDNSWD